MQNSEKVRTLTLYGNRIPNFRSGELMKYHRELAASGWYDFRGEECPADIVVNLGRPMEYDTIVKACVERASTAFLYQLGSVKRDLHEKAPDDFDAEISLSDLVYIDFSLLYTKSKENNNKNEPKEQFLNDIFENGLILVYRSVPHYMLPYIMSASMSRQSVMMFLDQALKTELDKRLNLNVLTYGVSYILSKAYAYFGLYLTEGIRIDEGDGFRLDENSVVVIDDESNKTRQKDLYTYTNISNSKREQEYGCRCYPKGLQKTDSDSFSVNCYDGEGMIDPEYADYIRRHLQKNGRRSAVDTHSFQIRMPFAKGMLHEVDFHRFCREEYGLPDNAVIVDVFGVQRKIRDIRIVMTKSMFKAYTLWNFPDNAKTEVKEHAIAEYFRQFHQYDHALYVIRTDQSLHNTGMVKLNYQFLNTGKLKKEEFDEILTYSLQRNVDAFLQDDEEAIRHICGSAGYDMEDDADEMIPDENRENDKADSDVRLKYAGAVAADHDFINEKKIRKTLKDDAESLYRKTMLGQILVSGESRYLSGDLLLLLRDFANHSPSVSLDMKKAMRQKINMQRLKPDVGKSGLERFYAPGLFAGRVVNEEDAKYLAGRGSMDRQNVYSVLRNPHLSRNEQCAMQPYIPQGDNLYAKYFIHLSGVLMIPYGSTVAARLGGADFDGDLVKVIDNTIFNRSAAECFRVMPFVEIPDDKGDEQSYDGMHYKHIRNIFTSRVGLISNMAIKLGNIEYNENRLSLQAAKSGDQSGIQPVTLEKGIGAQEAEPDYAAVCCILVGQEIDKAKTGIEPDLSVLDQAMKRYKANSAFLQKKEKIAEYDKTYPVMKDDKKDRYVVCNNKKDKRMILDAQAPEPGDSNLDSLAYTVLKRYYGLKHQDGRKRVQHRGEPLTPLKLRETEDKNLQASLACMVLAYRWIMKKARWMNHVIRQSNNGSYIYRILQKQYDYRLDEEIDGRVGSDTVTQALYKAYNMLRQTDAETVSGMRQWMKDIRWQNTLREDRSRVLFDHLGISDTEAYAGAAALLTNFSYSGYNLLLYIAEDVTREQNLSAKKDRAPDQVPDDIGCYPSYEDYYHEFDELLQTMMKDKSFTVTDFEKRIVQACRNELTGNLFKQPEHSMNQAVRYWRSICRDYDSSHTFLWKVFTVEEILAGARSEKEAGKNAE